MVASGSIASAGALSCPSLAPIPPTTSYITASNFSCPSGWTNTASASGALTTVYPWTLEESSYRGNGSQATRTVTSYVFDGFTASSNPISIEECTNLTTFGTTTITAFQPGLNSTITVFQSGDNASCVYSTVNSSGLITGYEQQKTVTQTGPTVTILYTVSPSAVRSESTTFELPQDTPTSNSSSTSSAESTASSVPSPTQTPIVANATDLQQQSTSPDPFVTAQVVKPEDNPPIAPNTKDTFLLVTFGNNGTSATSAGSFRKRQTSDQSLVYNATQSFPAIAGGIYNLSAAAASAPYGSSPPNSAITICGDSTCGPRSQLSTSFAEYSFTWTSPATQNSVATFGIQCAGQAYVALTNVTVTTIYIPQPTYSPLAAPAAASGNEMLSTYRFEPTREVTTTAYGTRTEYITATTSACLVPTTYYVTSTFETSIIQTTTLSQPTLTETFLTTEISTYVFSLTSTLPQATTVLYSTLTTTSRLPGNTSYLISTEIQNLTSTLLPTTIVLYSTILSELPASSITRTETSSLFLTDTAYITRTLDPQTFASISLSILPASTAYITSTLPASTAYFTFTTISDRIITQSTFLPASTIIETSLQPPSTLYVTQTLILPASTVLVTSTLPRGTFTPERVTETFSLPGETQIQHSIGTATLTLPASTVVSTYNLAETATPIIQTTLPASTVTSTYSLTVTTSLPRGTETATSIIQTTLPASTYVSTFRLTETATSIIQTTLPASTEYSTGTETFTLPALDHQIFERKLVLISTYRSTVVSTIHPTATTSLPPGTEIATSIIRTILPASTEYSTGTETLTLPASTIVSILRLTETTSLPARTEMATSIVQTTLPASTVSPITETTVQYMISTLPRQTDVMTYTSVRPAVGNKLHHGDLHAAATDYDNGFYTPRIDGFVTSTLPSGTTTLVSTYASTAVVTYTSVLDASTSSYLTATTTRERTQTVTAYTTLEASTYTSSTVYSTVQTTEVQTQVSTMPASSIYVTYTTTVQGQVSTVTFTYTPTTSTPGALLLCLAHGIHRHHSNCVRDVQLFYLFYFWKQSGYKYEQLKNQQPCVCDHDHNYNHHKSHIIPKLPKNVALRTLTVIAGSTTSATANVDDALFAVNVPFAVSLYGVASTTITVTSNGILAVASPVTTAYQNAALTQYSVCGTGLLAFWDDLIANSGRAQAHFLVSFWENLPGIATIDFLNITDNGVSATVGGQSRAAGLYAQYSFNQAVINNGLLITLNSTTNSWYTGYPPGIFAMPGAIYY
ncbi:hypothetical protein KC345_g9608 [Hortaea werneckii]|nr:hypothetical protein KC345_g9608 [Hortaea werneckii]